MRGRQISLLLQDPFTMLNPLMRVGTQIIETLAGSARGADEAIRRLAEVGIHDPRSADRTRSSSRAGCSSASRIAAALASDPSS